MGPLEQKIRQRLLDAFPDATVALVNDSRRHRSHKGNPGGEETHFHLTIVSSLFEGVPPLGRHRQVMALFKDLMTQGLHALALDLKAPQEALH